MNPRLATRRHHALDLIMRVALGLSYDGTAFHGWQTQPSGRTVQDTLETALTSFLSHPVQTICAGRTDAGVHALNQVVHLDTDAIRTPESWIRGLNALLPSTVAVQWATPVSDHFHARFAAQSRDYIYIVRNDRVRSPLLHNRVGWVYRLLDHHLMQQAALRLLGEHDFSCFRSSMCQASSPVRCLHALDITERGPYLFFSFKANAFLHHMIRNIMGTLIYVGLGRQPPEWVDELLMHRDRRRAAPTFAPDGLYLAGVNYSDEFALPTRHVVEALHALSGISIGPEGVV